MNKKSMLIAPLFFFCSSWLHAEETVPAAVSSAVYTINRLGGGSLRTQVTAADVPSEQGYMMSRVSLRHELSRFKNDLVELLVRPGFLDLRDPGLPNTPNEDLGWNGAMEFGNFGIAQDLDAGKAFLSQLTLFRFEILDPRDSSYKPVSWHTRIDWKRITPMLIIASRLITEPVGPGSKARKNRLFSVFWKVI